MISMPDAMKPFNAITTCLNNAGVQYSVEVPGRTLVGSFILRNAHASTEFRIVCINGFVINYTTLRSEIITPTDLVKAFMNLVNTQLACGCFEFVGGPAFRFRYGMPSIVFQETMPSVTMSLVQLPSLTFDRYLPWFRAIHANTMPYADVVSRCFNISPTVN